MENAIPNLTADLFYEVPLMLEREGLANVVVRRLGLICHMPDLTEWDTMVHRAKNPTGQVEIALVGKYVALHDAYLSVVEALTHGGIEMKVKVRWVDSETVTDDNVAQLLTGADGVLVPGGFGDRDIEGKISAVRYAREHKVPFLGICLGMQMAVVEYARHVCRMEDAHSSELSRTTAHPVIDLMPDQRGGTAKGGTLPLGAYPFRITSHDTFTSRAYGADEISERHRHRYEFNNDYRQILTGAGLVLAGLSPDQRLVEIVELPAPPGSWASSSILSSKAGRTKQILCSESLSARQKSIKANKLTAQAGFSPSPAVPAPAWSRRAVIKRAKEGQSPAFVSAE